MTHEQKNVLKIDAALYLLYFKKWKKGELMHFNKPIWVTSTKTGKKVLTAASRNQFEKNFMNAMSGQVKLISSTIKSVLKRKKSTHRKATVKKKVRFSRKISKKT